jgi:hypothetical protein
MNGKSKAALLVTSLLLTPVCFADKPAKDTITVVNEDATPEDVVSKIELPKKASDTAQSHSEKGMDNANNARESRGNETAAEARDQGKEFGMTTAAEARQDNPSAQLHEAVNEARNKGNSSDHRPTTPGKH